MIASVLIATLSALAAVQAAPASQKRVNGNLIAVGGSGVQMCLATTAPATSDGVGLSYIPCNTVQITHSDAPQYGLWQIVPGNQAGIQLAGTNYCLDAGTNPGSQATVQAKVWTCYPGLAQQQFYYTDDLHIAVTNYDSCLAENRYGAQFTACGISGVIETFTLLTATGGPITTSVSPTTTTAMTSAPITTSTTTSAASSTSTLGGTSLKPVGTQILDYNGDCLTVLGRELYNGAPVGVARCASGTDTLVNFQHWEYSQGLTQVCNHGFCLDFGTGGGSNGTPMKVWQQYPGLFQQTLYVTTDKHIAVYNGNQCLDLEAGTTLVQSWSCSGPDVNQLWTAGNTI